MFNLPNKLSIWYLVSGILLAFTFLLFSPPRPVYATCYCVNAKKDNCKCGATPPANATYSSTNAGVEVKCTSQAEANSVFENKNPICGSATETIPYCAPYKDGSGNYSCYGRAFAYGEIDQKIRGAPDGSWISNVGSFTFNGFPFTAKDVFVCDAGNFCCSPGENNPGCDDSNVPKGGSCTPQLSNVTPPVAICGGAIDSPGESRLWFPHIRLIAALSTIAQSLFNPKPSTLVKNTAPSNREPSLKNPTVVTTRIEEHQGANDGTTVVNTSDNNSSLIVGREAPAPLYSFGNTSDDNPYNDSAQCRIDNTFSNPGDDLVGPKITGSLYYTQKYEYTAQSKPAGCIADGSAYPADRSRLCCSGIYQSNLLCGKLEDVRIPTKGKIAVFVKNPLVEYIYNSLVAGSDSLFKRFMPGDKTQKFEEIGTPVTFDASATSANHGDSQTELAVGGDTGATPTLYVPHLGSLKKYWLDDLQKALRPKTIGATTTSEVGTRGQCNYSGGAVNGAIQNASSKYKVPASLLQAIFEIEGADYLANPAGYTCQENFAQAAGVMQITQGTYNVVTCENERISDDVGLCTEDTSRLSRCDVNDAFELGARTLLWKAGKWVYGPGNCQATGGISESNKAEIYNASCQYYGSFNPDNLTIAASRAIPAGERRKDGDMNYCDLICYKMGLCPPYPAR